MRLDLARVRRLSRSPAVLVLLVAMAVALVGAGGHVLHVHAGSSPGYYNEQHVLEGLAAISADAPLTEPLPAAVLSPVVGQAAPSPEAPRPVSAVRRAQPRAPPSA